MKLATLLSILSAGSLVLTSQAAVNVVVSQGEEQDLPVQITQTDLIQGLIAVALEGDKGWHSANSDPLDKLPAFTDGQGMRDTGVTGLLNDFPGSGQPAKRIEYTLLKSSDIAEVRIFSGNNSRDGRVFHTYTVAFSRDGGATFDSPIYVQSHPSGTLNNAQFNQWRAVLSQLRGQNAPLARGVTNLRFDFYAADNSQGQSRDPFDGLNPFTSLDDQLSASITSPLIWEIDVIEAPALTARTSASGLVLSWIGAETAVVQSSQSLDGLDWADVEPQPAITQDGQNREAVVPLGEGVTFFRLRQ
jgi:hypothetical protein